VYAELKLLGAGLEYIDVGGGLGVDYDGSGTNYPSSMNYTLNEYANDVVYRVASVCNARGIPHPMIVSESGRAIAAHHSVLVFNTLGSALDKFEVDGREDVRSRPRPARPAAAGAGPARCVSLASAPRRLVECYHDAMTAREQALQMFNLGLLSLDSAGSPSGCTGPPAPRSATSAASSTRCPRSSKASRAMLSDIYFCNMSVFQSLPDSWAIDQLFPIMPIHRLGEAPTRKAVLADITCDSDGKIDHFVSHRDVKRTLELHDMREGEEYYLAAFLVGAYQETLGDLHNLFGDTHVVHIRLHDDGGWWIEEIVKGDTPTRCSSTWSTTSRSSTRPWRATASARSARSRMTVAEGEPVHRSASTNPCELNGYAARLLRLLRAIPRSRRPARRTSSASVTTATPGARKRTMAASSGSSWASRSP
jgi:arginine decarboxylase